jgi:hypothetical protein
MKLGERVLFHVEHFEVGKSSNLAGLPLDMEDSPRGEE